MNYFARLGDYSPALFLLVLFALIYAAREVGFWLGLRHVTDPESSHDGVGTVVNSMLALLAFVLALTLSSSTSGFQERRQAILSEANAIGSAWSMAEAAKADPVTSLMADYTRVRRIYVEAPRDPARLAELETCTADLQSRMRTLAAAFMMEHPNPITEPLMTELNATFAAANTTRFAFNVRLHPQIFWLLMVMTGISVAGLGYKLGMRGQSMRILSALIILMWTWVMMNILDLGTARIGTMSADASVYQWLLDDLGQQDRGDSRDLPQSCVSA